MANSLSLIEKAKSKYLIYDIDEKYFENKLKEWSSKGIFINVSSKNTTPWQKKALKKDLNDRDKAIRNKERILYNHLGIKQIMSNNGLSASHTIATRVRGFSYSSKGYEFPKHTSDTVYLTGIGKEQFDRIIADMVSDGFKIKGSNDPSACAIGGHVSNISFEPFFNETELITK